MSKLFTFHNVSINSSEDMPEWAKKLNLHSTMFLLIHVNLTAETLQPLYLHSTMFLLIRYNRHNFYENRFNLHSTMFLLIPGISHVGIYAGKIYIPQCFY